MRVRVLFFGALREQVGPEVWFEASDGFTVAELRASYGARYPAAGPLFGACAVAINQQYAGPGAVLCDGDEVAFLPPVSGGANPYIHPEVSHAD